MLAGISSIKVTLKMYGGKRTFNFYYYRHNYDVTNMTQESERTTRIIKIIRIVTIKNQIGCIHDCDRINYATLKIGL